MENYLLLQKNSRVSLLVCYQDRYHIILVNNKLDEKNEEKVLAGNCSEAVMDEMELTRETIMKTDLRGVAIGGCSAGDVLVLYTKDKKLKYVLADDGSEEEMNAIFAGIPRFQAPKTVGSKAHKQDWRLELQDASTKKVMGPIGIALNVLGCGAFIGTLAFGRLSVVWSVICLAIMTVSLLLHFTYPQYLSIIGSKEFKRLGYTAKVKHLDFAIMGPALALTLRSLSSDFYFPNWWPLLIAGGVMSIVVSVIIYIFSREVREHPSFVFVVLLLSAAVSCSIVGQVNHLGNLGAAEVQICTVTGTGRYASSKGRGQYFCSVVLDSGTELQLPISNSVHQTLQAGDKASIFSGPGALGIEYAYFIEKE